MVPIKGAASACAASRVSARNSTIRDGGTVKRSQRDELRIELPAEQVFVPRENVASPPSVVDEPLQWPHVSVAARLHADIVVS
jgi:hypothetical protein